jgi:hypothetical protein
VRAPRSHNTPHTRRPHARTRAAHARWQHGGHPRLRPQQAHGNMYTRSVKRHNSSGNIKNWQSCSHTRQDRLTASCWLVVWWCAWPLHELAHVVTLPHPRGIIGKRMATSAISLATHAGPQHSARACVAPSPAALAAPTDPCPGAVAACRHTQPQTRSWSPTFTNPDACSSRVPTPCT